MEVTCVWIKGQNRKNLLFLKYPSGGNKGVIKSLVNEQIGPVTLETRLQLPLSLTDLKGNRNGDDEARDHLSCPRPRRPEEAAPLDAFMLLFFSFITSSFLPQKVPQIVKGPPLFCFENKDILSFFQNSR